MTPPSPANKMTAPLCMEKKTAPLFMECTLLSNRYLDANTRVIDLTRGLAIRMVFDEQPVDDDPLKKVRVTSNGVTDGNRSSFTFSYEYSRSGGAIQGAIRCVYVSPHQNAWGTLKSGLHIDIIENGRSVEPCCYFMQHSIHKCFPVVTSCTWPRYSKKWAPITRSDALNFCASEYLGNLKL